MKRFLRYLAPLVFIILIVLIGYKAGFIDLRKFPEPQGAKQITLNCTFKGQKLQIDQTLYQSIDDYYSGDPRKLRISYDSYVFSDEKDNTVKELTGKIKAKAEEMGLSKDQTMDLGTCFIQNIPYDTEKAKVVLSNDASDRILKMTDSNYKDRFPYETLYDNKGICTDKSYLEALILKEMGYGTALLTFDKEKHMAVGVSTPKGYTSFNTSYSYVETTSPGYKVGQLPTIDKNTGGAKKAEIERISGSQGNELIPDFPESDFTPPSDVIKISDGSEYQRIIEITNDINKLKSLIVEINNKNEEVTSYKTEIKNSEQEINAVKNELSASEEKVNDAKSKYKANPTDANYAVYSRYYDDYQSTYNSSKSVISEYNAKVDQYNALIRELNSLIDQYNQLLKSE